MSSHRCADPPLLFLDEPTSGLDRGLEHFGCRDYPQVFGSLFLAMLLLMPLVLVG